MKLSQLQPVQESRQMVQRFGGYNHNPIINNNEFYDMTNMTADNYPLLCPRTKRGVDNNPDRKFVGSVVGATYKDGAVYVVAYADEEHPDGKNEIWYKGKKICDIPAGSEDYSAFHKRELITLGAYVVVLPDKYYVNTTKTDDKGFIEYKYVSASSEEGDPATIIYRPCDVEGKIIQADVRSNTAPKNPTDGMIWLDVSQKSKVFKQYNESTGIWNLLQNIYMRIASDGIAAPGGFAKGDGVTLTGLDNTKASDLKELNGKTYSIIDMHNHNDDEWDDHEDPDYKLGWDWIIITAPYFTAYPSRRATTFIRKMPDMDFIIESGNRLWGCKYGKNSDGKFVNEIYASKLGDFKNWNVFDGASTDSYAATCGTDGAFTGAVNFQGYPIFFKEKHMHKVYGMYPAQYSITTSEIEGVAYGASQSIVTVNNVLVYKSPNGVCKFDGSYPTSMSSSFGDIKYNAMQNDEHSLGDLKSGAVACAVNGRYYITMKSEVDGEWYLFVHDFRTGLWHKHDNVRFVIVFTDGKEIFYLDKIHINDDQSTKPNASEPYVKMRTLFGSGDTDEDDIMWSVETGLMGMDVTELKSLSKIFIRMSMDRGSNVKIEAMYDSDGHWDMLSQIKSTTLRSFNIPIRPKRCDHFRLRISGRGYVKIYSFTKCIEARGDIK